MAIGKVAVFVLLFTAFRTITSAESEDGGYCSTDDFECRQRQLRDGSIFAKQFDAPPGHMEPLGSHQAAEEPFEELNSFITGDMFYKRFVQPGKPVVFRQAVDLQQVRNLNDDTWLKRERGAPEVTVEMMKKEVRGGPAEAMTLGDFLDRYKNENVYMADELPLSLRAEWTIPAMLLCGGYVEHFSNFRMWFSAGGTSSVLHLDSAENLHCVADGVKNVIMIDKQYTHHIGMDRHEDGSFSMDVDAVDMERFNMSGVPWWNVSLSAGDCVYIPMVWLHQVRSYHRNLGINVWWRHMRKFDNAECKNVEEKFSCRHDSLAGCSRGIPASEVRFKDDMDVLFTAMYEHVDAEGRLFADDFSRTMPDVFPFISHLAARRIFAVMAGSDEATHVVAKEVLTKEKMFDMSDAMKDILKGNEGGEFNE